MKKLTISIAFLILFAVAFYFSNSVEAAVRSRGYYKPSTGTYIQPYYRSSSNSTRWDNYSTQGNYNHFTGNPRTERAEPRLGKSRYTATAPFAGLAGCLAGLRFVCQSQSSWTKREQSSYDGKKSRIDNESDLCIISAIFSSLKGG